MVLSALRFGLLLNVPGREPPDGQCRAREKYQEFDARLPGVHLNLPWGIREGFPEEEVAAWS